MKFWLQALLKFFLWVIWCPSRYPEGPPRSGLYNAPTLVAIRLQNPFLFRKQMYPPPLVTPFGNRFFKCFLVEKLFGKRGVLLYFLLFRSCITNFCMTSAKIKTCLKNAEMLPFFQFDKNLKKSCFSVSKLVGNLVILLSFHVFGAALLI